MNVHVPRFGLWCPICVLDGSPIARVPWTVERKTYRRKCRTCGHRFEFEANGGMLQLVTKLPRLPKEKA